MQNVAIMALAFGLGAVAAPAARGDIPPLPGEQEHRLLNVIETSGHPCVQVGSFKPATGSDAKSYAGFDSFTVECTNGKSYLVALPQRHYGPPLLDPSGKPIPSPDPVVKELEK
jgi:hypothetical protein